MRDLKFRCWDGELMNTVSGLYFCQGGIQWDGPGVGSGWCSLNPDFNWESPRAGDKPDKVDILMQYTGLKDKNGVEIYEGDIISFHIPHLTTIKQKAVVYFCDKRACWCIKSHAWDMPIMHSCRSIEVIGNIHQHPHLLE